jgi:murein DD-endopeptidase MepM/ murein hydrolase activator NlpD
VAKKIKYHFNPESLSFERIQKTAVDWIKQLLLHAFSGISMGVLFFFIYLVFFETPDTKKYREENERLQGQYKVLQLQTKHVQAVMTDLQQRDDNLYRAILQAEPITSEIREGSFSNTNRYAAFNDMDNKELVVYTTQQVDRLSKMAYTQSKSYDALLSLVKSQEHRLLCIPAIMPVLNRDMKGVAGGYGRRIDPVYHVAAFHAGMDFTARTGTDVYATGEGNVVYASWKQGYGNCIILNHGYNYQTLYGHLSAYKVHVGQKVKRGDVIGAVGSTGKSTGPHLHYEVHFRGAPQNPAHYYFMDLSPAQYDQMIQISSNYGQTMD